MFDTKFESGSFSSFGNMTSQNLPLKNGESHRIQIFTPRKWILLLKKLVLMSRFVLFDPKFIPHVNFSNFQVEEIFSVSKFFRLFD